MSSIDPRTEQLTRGTLRTIKPVRVDGCEVYLASYQAHKYLRYTQGLQHITFDTYTKRLDASSFRELLKALFKRRVLRTYVINTEMPPTWDGEERPIPEDLWVCIADRLTRAVLQRYLEVVILSQARPAA